MTPEAMPFTPARGRRLRCYGHPDRARMRRNSCRGNAAAVRAGRCRGRRRPAPRDRTHRQPRVCPRETRRARAARSATPWPIQKSGLGATPKPANSSPFHQHAVAERRKRGAIERLGLRDIGHGDAGMVDHGDASVRIHAAADQVFEQRLLRVQAVLRLVPHDALRAVDDVGVDFLAAMRGQAMHEERVGLRLPHHGGVDHPVGEVALRARRSRPRSPCWSRRRS